jgi:hypothetical protein
MGDWTVVVAAGVGLLVVLGWIGFEERRRHWKRARRRRRCPHPNPCLEGVYRSREPGWAKEVHYCPDCKHLWARRVPISEAEWSRMEEPTAPPPSDRRRASDEG